MRSSPRRVVVRLVDAHMELNQDLLSMPSNQRAERLRSLASTGLAVWRLGLSGLPQGEVVPAGVPSSERG
ncbi:MAG: hypothetical protein KJ558_08035 [Gammaproteobacteria bacterium]|nr:hypothetical protein [Gammaproteobacteria bacterium]MBU1654763.1 hypothetical protein [Gammaproteobacteria bacterium]MBU1959660.1 hypothetical protein [Gammaproteobacteria bacterium]